MGKQKNDYFRMLEEQMQFCVRSANLLEQIFSEYCAEDSERYLREMHALERGADECYRTVLRKLSAEFITPIDQEDILRLIQITDDITDAIDEAVLKCEMYRIRVLPSDAKSLSHTVCRCVETLFDAITELKHFKKPDRLRTFLGKVSEIETEADDLYVQAVRALFLSDADAKELMVGTAVYESLEQCCDLCEHAADVIEQILLKNT